MAGSDLVDRVDVDPLHHMPSDVKESEEGESKHFWNSLASVVTYHYLLQALQVVLKSICASMLYFLADLL